MADKLIWIDALPRIEELRQKCHTASRVLQEGLSELNQALISDNKGGAESAYSKTLDAWSSLLNATDQFAGFGQLVGRDHPEQTKYLIGGTVLEITDNLLDCAQAISAIAGSFSGGDPLKLASEQPLAFQFAQELIAAHFPNEIERYRSKFDKLALPTKGLPAAPAGRIIQASGQPIRILHISDLHRTADEKVSNAEVANDLLQAIQRLDGGVVDLIVATGDLTQGATKSEYDECEELLKTLVDRLLKGDRDRCIVVPGNHDVDWSATLKGGFQVEKIGSKGPPGHMGVVRIGDTCAWPEAKTLVAATEPFRRSYKSFFGRDYPENDKERCMYLAPPALGVGMITVDTTIGMHHLNSVPHVSRDALITALATARGERSYLIAVGHHGPVRKINEKDAIESWVFDRLLQEGVSLYLHGHVHETQVYFHSSGGGIGVVSIGVGSLVAGAKERPESSPRHYHIVELPTQGKRGRVWVRRKDRRDLQWKPHKDYGAHTDPVDFIEFG